VPWATAFGAVFVSGVLFLVLLGYFVFVRSRI
jgi:xanthine/uracil/vitamin C permease (AzgA family)